MRRTPFYGDAEDAAILNPTYASAKASPVWRELGAPELQARGPGLTNVTFDEMTSFPPEAFDLIDVVTLPAGGENGSEKTEAPARTVSHPDYCEKGTEAALGFMPHDGENRQQRLAAVATWQPPKDQPTAKTAGEGSGDQDVGPEPSPVPTPRMPTRRELFEQRKKQRRGKLDPELRRLQREKAKTK